jgi:lipopolysaccharide cholinephosphotransferase
MKQAILNKLRKIELELLDEFIRICNEHNLQYFLIGGTLLGAVRHKGYIPWDDDIDIGMLREDYEKFIDICQKILDKNKYYIKCYRISEPYWFHYIKLCKTNTVFLEHDFLTFDETNGIFIDILPFDRVIKFPLLQIYQQLLMKILKIMIRAKIKCNNDLVKNKLLKSLLNLFSYNYLQKIINNTATMFGYKKTKYVGLVGGGYGYKRETHLITTILPLSKILFENKYYAAPNKPEVFLTSLYGSDYMEIPPIEKRVSHTPKLLIFDTTKESIPRGNIL